MWKNAFLLLIFVSFSVGCNSTSSVTPIEPASHATNTIVTSPNPILTFTPISEDSSFTEISLAYQNAQAFSIHPDFLLLVKTSEDRMGLFNLSTMKIENEQMFSGSVVGYPVVSEDGILFAQITFQGDGKILLVKNI